MKKKDIKKMTKSELAKNLENFKKDLFNLRFQKSNGQLTNFTKISETKKMISRIKSNQKFLGKDKWQKEF